MAFTARERTDVIEMRLRREKYPHVPHLEPERGDPGANRLRILRHAGINQDVPGRRGDEVRGQVHRANVVDVVDDVDGLRASGPGIGDGHRLGSARRRRGQQPDNQERG